VIILTARASERLVPATARDHCRPARLPAIHAPGAFLPATDGHADGGIIFADEHACARAEMLLPAVKGRIAARYRRYCQLEGALGDEAGTKAGQSQAGWADQARTEMPVTARQVAKRSSRIWR